jgi:hypothetical protein
MTEAQEALPYSNIAYGSPLPYKKSSQWAKKKKPMTEKYRVAKTSGVNYSILTPLNNFALTAFL